MAAYAFGAARVFVDEDLAPGVTIETNDDRAHYLGNVLRLKSGDGVLVFNGRDGEWRARLAETGKRRVRLVIETRERAQTVAPQIDYCFAPLKHARLDYMAQKAVEMGATRLRPVRTRRTHVARVNLERLRANAIEAAEQCGVLVAPTVEPEMALERMVAQFDDRPLIFCDEDAPMTDPLAVLAAARPAPAFGVLVGPEGGFDDQERALLLAVPRVVRLSLGPRILRADTAAVAILALAQAVLTDNAGVFDR